MARLFVALRPPPAVRQALLATHGGVAGARWQDDAQLHLTLRFVGETGGPTAGALMAELSAIVAPGFTLRIMGVGHFERRGRPAALWAGLAPNAELAGLQRAIERACRAAGLPPEPRSFAPHVTIARLGSNSAGAGAWIAAHGTLTAPDWPVDAFGLYESTLTPSGARYTALAKWPLTGRPPP